ncbi:hypothetical protein HD806DRAFT_266157 [Xylariaceae sp. AK1471]|nr:hypothetical protein HD806DRAFT_266157 [Xylariaceae sp. AK1471]
MFSSPPSPPSSPSSPTTRVRPSNGQFRNGSWYCNCPKPRKAYILRVTANTKNYGRLFYTCPIDPEEGKGNSCRFFLLHDDAEKRQKKCFWSNNRSEMRQTTLHDSITPRKGKQAAVNGALTPALAAALTSTSALPPRSTTGPSTTAESSTLKGSSEGTPEQPVNIYDTTSDEEEEEKEGIKSPTKSRTTTNNNNNLQAGTIAQTPTMPSTGSKRKQPADDVEDLFDNLSADTEDEWIAMTEKSSKTRSTHGRHDDTSLTPTAPRNTNADMETGLATPLTKGKSPVERILFPPGNPGESSCSAPTPLTKGKSPVERILFPPRNPGESSCGTSNAAKRQRLETAATIPSSSSSSSSSTTPQVTPAEPTREVMVLLNDAKISDSLRNKVRRTLDKHAAQTKELKRRNAELNARVEELEQGNKSTKTKLLNLFQEL